jgi:hypothetical protein
MDGLCMGVLDLSSEHVHTLGGSLLCVTSPLRSTKATWTMANTVMILLGSTCHRVGMQKVTLSKSGLVKTSVKRSSGAHVMPTLLVTGTPLNWAQVHPVLGMRQAFGKAVQSHLEKVMIMWG